MTHSTAQQLGPPRRCIWVMNRSQPYTGHERVRTHDLDSWDRLRTSSLLRYFEQVAWDASAAASFSTGWYTEQGTGWVIRRMIVQRFGPAAYDDQLAVTTWISQVVRVRGWREYEVRRPDGSVVAAGQAEWVYIDRASGRPRAVDPEIMRLLPALDPSPLRTPPPSLSPAPPVAPHTVTRRVWRYEADAMGHVNNTIYADWLDEAAGDALRAWGHPLVAPAAAGLVPVLQHLSITYLRAALPGDEVTLTTTQTGASPDMAEIALAQTITQGTQRLIEAEVVYRLVQQDTGAGTMPAAPRG